MAAALHRPVTALGLSPECFCTEQTFSELRVCLWDAYVSMGFPWVDNVVDKLFWEDNWDNYILNTYENLGHRIFSLVLERIKPYIWELQGSMSTSVGHFLGMGALVFKLIAAHLLLYLCQLKQGKL